MPSNRIAVTPPMLADIPGLFDPLRALGLSVDINPGPYPLDAPALARFVGDAPAALIGLDPVDQSLLAACPHLRHVARNGVGMDTVDLDAATRRGVLVTAPYGANIRAIRDAASAVLKAA